MIDKQLMKLFDIEYQNKSGKSNMKANLDLFFLCI